MLRSAPFWYRNFPRLTHAIRRIAGANYEREMELLDLLCDRQRTGIDVGAKVGMYTYRIRDRSAKVIAFEPIPLFNQMLAKVFAGKRGQVEPYALSDKHGRATLRVPYQAGERGQFGRSTIEATNPLEHWQIQRCDEIEVETRTLDEYALSDVGFIKIDVEGHELAVLAGATQTVKANRPAMLIECNDDLHPDARASLARWLAEHEYRGYFLFGREMLAMEVYEPQLHWRQYGIENFICLHHSRAELADAIKARVPSLPPAKPVTPDRVRDPAAAGRA